MELSPQAANKAADAVTAMLRGGTLRLYSRELVELVALRFASPAFRAAVDGRATAQPLESARAKASGAPTHFVAQDALGSVVITGTVGRQDSGADLTVPVETISAGAEVLLHTLIYRQPMRD